MDEELDTVAIDRRIARIAERQHGVVARTDLAAMGLGRGAIDSRIRRGRLHAVRRGVYAVGHRSLTREGRWLAAVLTCGDGSLLSHITAGAHWDVRRSSAGTIHVTVPASAGRAKRPGIVLHRCVLHPDDCDVHEGIPVTSVARTLVDLAAVLPSGQLERAVERATFLRFIDVAKINAALARRPRRRGARRLAVLMRDLHHEPQLTRGELEGCFLDLCDANGLPRPQVNQYVEGLEVDFLWRTHRLIVEADDRLTHATPQAFERDRARDVRLQIAGYRVVRFTYRQIVYEPDEVARKVRDLLAAPYDRSISSIL